MRSAFGQIQDLGRRTTALFLDFDGTLTPIVNRPDQVLVEDRTVRLLARLMARLDGALAIISGREIATLDRFFSPHTFPASGVHGLEWRMAGTSIERLETSDSALGEVARQLAALTARHGELLLERKLGSVALHYRSRPDLFELCSQSVTDAVAGRTGLVIVEGKMVIEVKGHGGSKGLAIETFMREPPFACRIPVFVGDDVTDEAGFTAVNSLGGTSIKVGRGDTVARYRLKDAADVEDWLDRLAKKFDSETSAGAVKA